MLISAGINIPDLIGSPEEWPFPLKTIGELGKNMGAERKNRYRKFCPERRYSQLEDITSFYGFLFQASWRNLQAIEKLMRELLDAFWTKLFFGAEPKPIDGFDFGGTTNIPFSRSGCRAEGNVAILGLLSPESIRDTEKLESLMKSNEKSHRLDSCRPSKNWRCS